MAIVNTRLTPGTAGVQTTVTQIFYPATLSATMRNRIIKSIETGILFGGWSSHARGLLAIFFEAEGVHPPVNISALKYWARPHNPLQIEGFHEALTGRPDVVKELLELSEVKLQIALAASNRTFDIARNINTHYPSRGHDLSFQMLDGFSKADIPLLAEKLGSVIVARPDYQRAAAKIIAMLKGNEPFEIKQ